MALRQGGQGRAFTSVDCRARAEVSLSSIANHRAMQAWFNSLMSRVAIGKCDGRLV